MNWICNLHVNLFNEDCLKGVIWCFLKIIILCIWRNRICWHALMFKKHIIFQILYIIVGPMCPASLKRFVFYKVPPSDKRSLLWLAKWPRALWLAEHHKPRRKCNSPFHICKLQLSKLKTVNNVLSFTISSSPKGEQSRVTDSDEARMCLHTSRGCVTLSPSFTNPSTNTHDAAAVLQLWLSISLSHTHTHTRRRDYIHTKHKTLHLNSQ